MASIILRNRAVASKKTTSQDLTQPDGDRHALTFLDLPPEIHLLISDLLIYPDALSLKQTCRRFHYLVDTGIKLKIDWLVERRRLHLECPNDQRCDLGSDLRFCRGSVKYVLIHKATNSLLSWVHTNTSSLRLLMQRRREHIECESRPGLGCLVYGTSTCSHRRKLGARATRWMRTRLTVEMWWVLLATVPVLCCWLWMAELLS